MTIIMTTSKTGTTIAVTRRARMLNKAVVTSSKVARTASQPESGMAIIRGGCTLIGRPGGTNVRSAVFTITVTVVDDVPLGVTGFAVVDEQLAPAGRPLQLRVIGCASPPIGVIVRLNCADLPAGTAAEVGVAENVKSDCWPNPVPVSRTTCGLPRALSVSVSAPTLEPAVVGV